MESLNLNTLVSSLPTAQQNAEKELLNNFKAAALSITTLYRSSRQNSKRAYNAGYAAACQDMLNFIQQGVSAGGITSGPSDEMGGGGMTIGRVMDWTEARLDAIKAREEEEDEDEEREKEKERGRPTAPTPAPATSLVAKSDARKATASGTSTSGDRPKEAPSSLPTPHSPRAQSNTLPLEPSSPSPASSTTTLRPTQRPTKSRPPTTKGDPPNPSNPQIPAFNLISESHPSSPPFSDTPIAIGAGAKRRHAMMMMLDSGSTPVSIGGSSIPPPSPSGPGNINGVYGGSPNHSAGVGMNRRRTRSTRSLTHQAHQQAQNQNINMIQVASEAMDIEEDGRERKRVARR